MCVCVCMVAGHGHKEGGGWIKSRTLRAGDSDIPCCSVAILRCCSNCTMGQSDTLLRLHAALHHCQLAQKPLPVLLA